MQVSDLASVFTKVRLPALDTFLISGAEKVENTLAKGRLRHSLAKETDKVRLSKSRRHLEALQLMESDICLEASVETEGGLQPSGLSSENVTTTGLQHSFSSTCDFSSGRIRRSSSYGSIQARRGQLKCKQILRLESGSSLGTCTPSTRASTPVSLSLESKDLFEGKSKTISRWRLGSKIGQGSYGSVYKAIDLDDGAIFAVKKSFLDVGCKCDQFVDKLKDELSILQELDHPNIVKCLGSECHSSSVVIFMEYAAGGSLSSLLAEFGPLEGAILKSSALGILRGLHYLHSRSPPVCHRDLKCANVLVDLSSNVKLADFGCSKCDNETKSFTTVGSIPWMAPEVIQQENGHGRKADIWSLGCTIIEMATAEVPWGKGAFDNPINAMRLIGLTEELPPMPSGLPKPLQELLEACLVRDVQRRFCSVKLLKLLGNSSGRLL
jgi:hypothetical protein